MSDKIKRYFHIDSDTLFIHRSGLTFVHFFYVFLKDKLTGKLIIDARMHSDAVDDDRDIDSFIMWCNKDPVRIPKYEQLKPNKKKIRIWFTDSCGTKIPTSSVDFIVSGLLEFY